MTRRLADHTDFISQPTYLPRITVRDGRAIEEALAGPTLFDRGVPLEGAVIEATYAATDPLFSRAWREGKVPCLIDPQTLRLTGERFLSVEQFERLAYSPNTPIRPDGLTQAGADELAKRVIRFERDAGASWYVTAALPYHDLELDDCVRRTPGCWRHRVSQTEPPISSSGH
jgi:hypothetical protein